MARKFFIGSVGKPGYGYDEENRKRCIAQNAHIMHEDTKQKGVFNNVKSGDICFLKYQHVIIAFGEVKNVVILTDESLDGWTHYIYVNQWFFYSNDKEHGVSKYGISKHTYGGAGQMATVKQLDPEFGLQKMKEIGGENNQLYKLVKSEYTMNQLNNEITRSLLSNHNLILTGAPGTGKTYLAKQIAQQLIFDEVKENFTDDEQKQFDEQCGFVQFHPSYDYTDFVEGLRPIQDGNGNVGFERKDGVFKEFCINALNNPNKNFVFIIDEINRGEISKIFGELFFSIDPGYRGIKGKVKTQYQNMVEVGDEFFDGFYVPENVYIIGTMNDIDRSVESMDFAFRRRFAFKEIKADKSMKMLDDENAWKDEQDNIVKPSTDVLGKLKNRMNNLNNKIWHKAKTDEKEEEKCIDGLSSAYHIGAAYFLKLKNYRDDADGGFENLWNNHLEGLLREYLRGSLNIEESIAKLKAAYNNESPENNG